MWNLVGRVCFHLAKVQHTPLGQAVAQAGAPSSKQALLALLVPVEAEIALSACGPASRG